jgi:hypothetical protein
VCRIQYQRSVTLQNIGERFSRKPSYPWRSRLDQQPEPKESSVNHQEPQSAPVEFDPYYDYKAFKDRVDTLPLYAAGFRTRRDRAGRIGTAAGAETRRAKG